ncbi:hypothetical protein D1872_345200 [compost metagenome]
MRAVSKEDQKRLISGTDGIGSPFWAFCMVALMLGSVSRVFWKDFSATAPSGLSAFTGARPASVSR